MVLGVLYCVRLFLILAIVGTLGQLKKDKQDTSEQLVDLGAIVILCTFLIATLL